MAPAEVGTLAAAVADLVVKRLQGAEPGGARTAAGGEPLTEGRALESQAEPEGLGPGRQEGGPNGRARLRDLQRAS